MPGSFFDSNVLLYAVSADSAKADRAEELIEVGGTISTQVLNEVVNVARRKMRLSWPETHGLLSMIRDVLAVEPLTIAVHATGIELAERYNLSVFDAMIAASALHAGCDTLWSEDMQDEMLLADRIRIIDPFRH